MDTASEKDPIQQRLDRLGQLARAHAADGEPLAMVSTLLDVAGAILTGTVDAHTILALDLLTAVLDVDLAAASAPSTPAPRRVSAA